MKKIRGNNFKYVNTAIPSDSTLGTTSSYDISFKPIAKTIADTQVVAAIMFDGDMGTTALSWDKGSTIYTTKVISRFLPPDFLQDYDSNAIFDENLNVVIPQADNATIGLKLNKSFSGEYKSPGFANTVKIYYEIEIIHNANDIGIGVGSFIENLLDIDFLTKTPLPNTFDGNKFGLSASYKTKILRSDGSYYVNGVLNSSITPFAQTPGTTIIQILHNPISSTIDIGIDNTWVLTDISLDNNIGSQTLIMDVTGNTSAGGSISINKTLIPVYPLEDDYILASISDAMLESDTENTQYYSQACAFDTADNGTLAYITWTLELGSYFNILKSDDFGYTWKPSQPVDESVNKNSGDGAWFTFYAGNNRWFITGGYGDYVEINQTAGYNTGWYYSDDNLETFTWYQPEGLDRQYNTQQYSNIPHSYYYHDTVFQETMFDGNQFMFHGMVYPEGDDVNNTEEWGEQSEKGYIATSSDNGETFKLRQVINQFSGSAYTPFEKRDYLYYGLNTHSKTGQIYAFTRNYTNSAVVEVFRTNDGFKTWEMTDGFIVTPSNTENVDYFSGDFESTLSSTKRPSAGLSIIGTPIEYFHSDMQNLSYYNSVENLSPLAWWKLNNKPESKIFENLGSVNVDLKITNDNYSLCEIGPIRHGPVSGIRLNTSTDGQQFLYIDNDSNQLALAKTIEFWTRSNYDGNGLITIMGQILAPNEWSINPSSALGCWTHVVVVLDEIGTSATWYKNGVRYGSTTVNLTAAPIHIGRLMTTSTSIYAPKYNLEIAEICFYSQRFTKNEILEKYLRGMDYLNIRD